MKRHLLFYLFIFIGIGAFAQIGIIDIDGNNVEETEIHVYLSLEDEHVEFDFKTENNTDDSATYNLRRWELDYIEGSVEYYCWSLCLGPVAGGTDYLSVFPGGGAGYVGIYGNSSTSYGSPAFHFNSLGNTGLATYRYVIYNIYDANDTTWVDMVYHVDAVGVEEYDNNAISSVYPSPAFDIINVDLKQNIENARFEFFSMVGTRIQAEQIRNVNGKITIDVSALTPGIYMLQEMESQITRKFIISR